MNAETNTGLVPTNEQEGIPEYFKRKQKGEEKPDAAKEASK